MKIVFWGSSDFSMPALKALFEKGWIVAVVTNPDKPYGRGMHEIHKTPLKIWAEEKKIPCLQPVRLRDQTFLEELANFHADLFVVVSYGRILPKEILQMPPLGAINLHASLLPRYRGASPIQAAILHGDTFTGNTIQYVSEALDCGDIILQSQVPILPNETYPTLSQKLALDGAILLTEAITQISEGKAKRIPQNEAHATYTKIIKREDGKISFFTQTAEEIFRRFRAYQPWPGIFTTYHQTKTPFPVHLTSIEPYNQEGEPGIVLQANKEGFIVACKQGAINLLSLKPAGKKEMAFLGFINGYRPQAGKAF
ncbi:methionyl-tRNA formyltransferase [Thermospira aquatica]|uniref:Methionyl-tRNA formyltransferase n=1 Tax=Thermospira aquatica TaxID=2828656 RepID=A0AAX3BFJ3_9SPIR|nr:methionyl-tRNA formyltransferase [Thermospira aquatica]URA11137.1 methionyl-tRNA formyltransferase [Thermospira aquatica]